MLKNIFLTLICFSLWGAAFSQRGKVIESKIYSKILGADKGYSVYLPPGYDSSKTDYPVLYLLHGAWGCHTDWAKYGNVAFYADKAIKGGTALPMIIIMPDASGVKPNHAGRHMGYFNYPEWRYHDFFVNEFIPVVEKQWHTKSDKQHRAIAGLSMGADGTVYLAQHFPDYFSSACALSGGMVTLGAKPTEDVDSLYFDQMEKVDPLKTLRTADEQKLNQFRSIRWYVDCGDDDWLLPGSILLYQAMKEKKVPLEFRIRDGEHTWDYWQTGLTDILPFISIGFSK